MLAAAINRVPLLLLAIVIGACSEREFTPVELAPGIMSGSDPRTTFAALGLGAKARRPRDPTNIPATDERAAFKIEQYVVDEFRLFGCAGEAHFGFHNDRLFELIFYPSSETCPLPALPAMARGLRAELETQEKTIAGRRIVLQSDFSERWYVEISDSALLHGVQRWIRRHS